jgi:hypothetical protein
MLVLRCCHSGRSVRRRASRMVRCSRRVLRKSVERIFLRRRVSTSLCDHPGRRESRPPPWKTRPFSPVRRPAAAHERRTTWRCFRRLVTSSNCVGLRARCRSNSRRGPAGHTEHFKNAQQPLRDGRFIMKYAIFGSGKVGTALARIFARKNIEVAAAPEQSL